MKIALRPVAIPDFGIPLDRPLISASTYEKRCANALERAGADWLVVYADREHAANIAFLTGFEPRFEEALLLLGSKGRRIIVTGNENLGYTPIAGKPGIDTLLAQSLSLMAQDRTIKPNLGVVLREAGIAAGDSVGLVGWKYLQAEEWTGVQPTFFVPAFVVDTLKSVIGTGGTLGDATPIMMNPVDGIRAVVDVDQIAEAEWAAARASAAVWRIVSGYRLGDSELSAMSRMGYAGEPMACHPMFASASGTSPVIGLRSATSRVPVKGDGVTTAVAYWGGLTARAGLIATQDDAFLDVAKAYFRGLVAWYETARIGAAGGDIHEAVISKLAESGLRSALNPGHIVGHDEWMNSPIRPGSTEPIVSGMPFQVDVIPVPMPGSWSLNCEDAVTFADGSLQAEIASRHPEVADRFSARRLFVKDQLGVPVGDDVLLLSNIPLCLPPFWLDTSRLLALE